MNRGHATILGMIAVMIWGTFVGLIRSLSEQLGMFRSGGIVYLTAGLLNIALNYMRTGAVISPRRFSRRLMLGLGGLFVLDIAAFYSSIGLAHDRNQLLEVGLVNYIWPVLTVIFSIPILGNRAKPGLLPAVMIVLAGVVLVTTQPGEFSLARFAENLVLNPGAYLLAFLAALVWALYSNLSRLWAEKNQDQILYVFMLAAGATLLAMSPIYEEDANWNLEVVIELVLMSLAIVIGYIFWDLGVRLGSFKAVSVFSYFTPLISTLFASLYLQVFAGPRVWIGCALIIFGAYLSQRSIEERG